MYYTFNLFLRRMHYDMLWSLTEYLNIIINRYGSYTPEI